MYTDKRGWVLLTQPKTGSTTARAVCHRYGDGTSNHARVHLAAHEWRAYLLKNARAGWARELAEDPSARVYGTIREPGAWYRSVWAYARSARYGEDGRRWLVRWAHQMGAPPGRLIGEWVRRGGLPGAASEEMLNPDPRTDAPTLYQASVRHYYGAGVDGWVRLEHQARDLAGLLGVPEEAIAAMGIKNATPGDRDVVRDCGDLLEGDREFWRECSTLGRVPEYK